jgi:hypothetical protein
MHTLSSLQGTYTVRWERARPLPVVAEALLRRVATGMPLQQAIAGEGDDELEALAALEMRIRRGAVVADASPAEAPASPAASAPSPMTRMTPPRGSPRASATWQAGPMTEGAATAPPPRDHGRPTTNQYVVEPAAATQAMPHSDTAVAVSQAAAPITVSEAQQVERFAAAAVHDWFDSDEEAASGDAERRDLLLAGLQASARVSGPHAVADAAVAVEDPAQADHDWQEAKAGPTPSSADKRPSRRWGRGVAASVAVAAVAVAVAVGWRQRSAPRTETATVTAFRAAVAQWDGGDPQGARQALQQIDTAEVPEADLHLAILELQSGQSQTARPRLERYLRGGRAQHDGQTRRLYRHVYGVDAPPAAVR